MVYLKKITNYNFTCYLSTFGLNCIYLEGITMQMQGITIDFNDKRTCGLLPDLCLEWDSRYDELDDNQQLIDYWESNLKKVTDKTHNIVSGNIETESILYSADPYAIELIKEVFKEIKMDTIEYSTMTKCDHCLDYDYLDENFKAKGHI